MKVGYGAKVDYSYLIFSMVVYTEIGNGTLC